MKRKLLKEEKTKAAQGRKNKKGSKKGDMEEVSTENKTDLTLNCQVTELKNKIHA